MSLRLRVLIVTVLLLLAYFLWFRGSRTQDIAQKTRQIMVAELNSVHASEVVYFAEFKTYTTDLRSLGWKPEAELLNYRIGFVEPSLDPLAEGEDPGQLSTDAFLQDDGSDSRVVRYGLFAEGINIGSLGRYCAQRCTASKVQFEVIAAANLDADLTLDIWRINESGVVLHVSDDLGD